MKSCVCGKPVKRDKYFNWQQFCSPACAGRTNAKKFTHAQRVAWGKEGGVVKNRLIAERVIERYEVMGRDGYWAAYKAGRHALKVAELKARA